MIKKIIIAIDGPSSSGKSTLAMQLAQKLNYIHIDTGAMYRIISLFCIEKGFFKGGKLNKHLLISSLNDIDNQFQIEIKSNIGKIKFNTKEIERSIRTIDISNIVSLVAEIPEVRKKLTHLQRLYGREGGVVMDGRDIGTVVFPKAELKIFLNASLIVRAKRRYEEIYHKNSGISYLEVLNNLSERDKCDIHRKIAPLKRAQEAVEINNNLLSLQQQLFFIYKLAKKVIDN